MLNVDDLFKGRHFDREIIVLCVRWYLRYKFFELAEIAANARRGKNAAPISPIALEAVKRIDAIFEIEREINGVAAEERLAARPPTSAPLVPPLEGGRPA